MTIFLSSVRLPSDWGIEPKSRNAGWWGRAITVEFAIRALQEGTAPILSRDKCSPSTIAESNGLLKSDSSKLSDGIRFAVRSGLIRVINDGLAIKLPDSLFASQVSDNTGNLSNNSNLSSKAQLYQSVTGKKSTSLLIGNTKSSNRGRPGIPGVEEVELFQRWRVGLGKSAKAKLDQKRLRAIRKATRVESKGGLGFAIDDLRQSIDGWVALCREDSWRMERPSRHELTLFLRDSEHIEWGMDALSKIQREEPDVIRAMKEAMGRRND